MVKILIGEDSSSREQFFDTADTDSEIAGRETNFEVQVIRNEPRLGLGANLNMLLQTAQAQGIEYAIQMDDDHILVKPLDIARHVAYLEKDKLAGWIRLMQVGSHKFIATLEDYYWRVSWLSDELYITSNRPMLKAISRFHSMYGYYAEGLKLGLTEESFCHQCKDIALARKYTDLPTVDVLVPLDTLTESSWEHIGDSWQLKGF